MTSVSNSKIKISTYQDDISFSNMITKMEGNFDKYFYKIPFY